MSKETNETATALKHNTQLVADADSDSDIIVHVDCDCFYAACERIKEPALRGEPLVIGMGYDSGAKHGAVATASYEAREYGVDSAMPIEDALEKLPRREAEATTDTDTIQIAGETEADTNPTAYYRPVDLDYYEEKGSAVHDILESVADVFQPVSVDEAYLDVTSKTDWDSITDFIETIQSRVNAEENIPVSVGAAPTKSAAKVASDYNKPDGTKVVKPGAVKDFFADLPVSEIHGIGDVTGSKLRGMGIETGGDLASADPDMLADEFGSRGVEIHQRARGHDPREVSPPDDPKSISNESSLGKDGADSDTALARMEELCDKVGDRVVEKNAFFRTVSVKVVLPPFTVKTRARSLPGSTQSSRIIHDVTNELFTEFKDDRIRKIGVRVSNLSFSEATQQSLAEWSEDSTQTSRDEISGHHKDIPNIPQDNRQTVLHDYV